jgi:hypothetical protein
MEDYYSCIHVSAESVKMAVHRCKAESRNAFGTTKLAYLCSACKFHAPSIHDARLRDHANQYKHFVYIRNSLPSELYCFECRDFQFSSVFDRYQNRKRPKKHVEDDHQGGSVVHKRQIKGLCNMGATCYMSSVLQVLMNNLVLTSCDQMQLSVERCKGFLERSMSIDVTNNINSTSATGSNPLPMLPCCVYCGFKGLIKDSHDSQ